ncbi:MAG: CAP domain-containing protein [Isosphaeraceae bacterium]
MTNGPRRPRAASFSLDTCGLDGRILPASGVVTGLAGGVLTIVGTPGDDAIGVDVMTRRNRPNGPAIVKVSGGPTVPAARVRQITILAGEGDNQIRVSQAFRRLIPVRIEAGDGDNSIQTGNEDDRIRVGAGNNTIDSGGGNDVIIRPAAKTPAATAPATPTPAPTPAPSPAPDPTPTPPPSPTPPSNQPPSVDEIGQQILVRINQQRAAAGLAPLVVNARLSDAATIQADNMARLDILSHTLNGTSTPTFGDRLNAVGYGYRAAAENIAWGYSGAADVVQGWMSSPGHRTNILNRDYAETGIAVRYNAAGDLYFAQVFGDPA